MTRFVLSLATAGVIAAALAAQPTGPAPRPPGARPAAGTQPSLSVRVEEKNPWTRLELRNAPQNFQFAIVTDRTGGHRPGVFEAAAAKLNLLQPEFVMSVGDLIEGYKEDPEILAAQWREFNGFVTGLEMPFFYVPGNHDLSNAAMVPIWQNQFGRTYFHFVYHDVLFVALNSEDPPGYKVDNANPGHLGEEQLKWLKSVLEENAGVRWTLVFLHKPMWHYGNRSNWNAVEELLGDRPRTVFAGHEHRFRATKVGPWTYYALATTGGSSKLRGPKEGEFDHVVWVTMTSQGPKMANLMLDGVWTENPVAEAAARP